MVLTYEHASMRYDLDVLQPPNLKLPKPNSNTWAHVPPPQCRLALAEQNSMS